MVLEKVRKVAREADAADDEAEKRAREKRARVSGMNRKARRAAAQKEDKQAAVRAIVQARVEAKKRAVVAKKRAEAAVFEARVAERKARVAERDDYGVAFRYRGSPGLSCPPVRACLVLVGEW